jgi:hypothetical protein
VNRTALIVMIVLGLGIGVPAAAIKSQSEKKPKPEQELARAVLVPTEKERRVIVPPCGTGVPLLQRPPDELAETPGTIRFVLHKDRGDRIVLVPRCRAAHGAQTSEGANLPSAAFVLPIAANLDAGRGGSREAGAERVQGQLIIPARSPIKTIVVPRCIESHRAAVKSATGRALVLDPPPERPKVAVGPPS